MQHSTTRYETSHLCRTHQRKKERKKEREQTLMAVIPQDYADILRTNALAHIATIGPRGEPQSTPVWFDWDGTNIRFSQIKTRQKYRNLLRDPHIALSIVDPTNPYRYLEIRGKVVRIDEDPNLDFINS